MSNKYEKITLEELGILGDDVYNPTIWDQSNIDSLHKEVDEQVREGCYLEKVRFYNKGDRVQIAYNCSPGVKPIVGNTMYITECIYGDKPYQDCYKVSESMDDNIFWVVCHSDIEGMWKPYFEKHHVVTGTPIPEPIIDPIRVDEPQHSGDRDGDNLACPVDDNTSDKTPECTHKIELKSFKREFVTYCTRCGKIFSSRKKRK